MYSVYCDSESQFMHLTLDDQTQVDLKSAGQPEQAQPTAMSINSPNLVLCACPLDGGDQASPRFLCNVIDMRALIGPCSHVTSRSCQISDPCYESSASL